jgi:biotin transport system substrate-specific component
MVFDVEGSLKYNSRPIASFYICGLEQLRFPVFTDGVDMLTSATVADLLRPCEKSRAIFYDIALIIGGSLLIGLCAQVAIQPPFSPVPVTGQTFAVLMIGALLGARRGCLAVLAYIIEGAGGLPVFALGRGGFAVLLGPTGGYLIGFVAAAYITGSLAERGWDRRIGTTVLAMVFGNVAIYTFGLLWLSWLIGSSSVLAVGLYPFVAGDLLKITLAAILLPSGWKLLGYGGLAGRKG